MASLTTLLTLADSRLPTGGHVHSGGVEEAVSSRLVVDLDTPGEDGCALIRRVRRVSNPPAVVVVTAHTAQGVRLAAVDAGASAFLLKPADPVALAKLVGRLSDRP